MSTALFGIINANRHALSASVDNFSVNIEGDQKEAFLRSVFEIWRSNIAGAEVAFDCNRGWAGSLPLINKLLPESRVIACIRNPAWIVDSFERAFQKDPVTVSKVFGGIDANQSVYLRARTFSSVGTVAGALNSLKDLYHSPFADRALLLDYEILTREPGQAMRLIYEFLGEPWFQHDFENVEYSSEAFDEALGLPGLHTVKKKVEFVERETVLLPDLFEEMSNKAFWTNLSETKATTIIGEEL